MAIQTTRWSPDTCPCVVDYTWDSNVAPEARTHTIVAVVTRCAPHALLLTLGSHFAALLDENTRKNLVWDRAVNTLGIAPDAVSWAFDPVTRLLTVTCGGATAAQKTTAQTWADTKFGLGKVLIA